MAAYIPVPRDLTRVKTKVFLNLTKRQLICFGLAALIGVPSFFLIKSVGSTSLAAMCMIIIMIAMFLLPMSEPDGQPLEASFFLHLFLLLIFAQEILFYFLIAFVE